MKKAVLKLNLNDDRTKQRAMRTVSGLSGVDSVSMDMKDQKLTVTGDMDPVIVVRKLRKLCVTELVTVGAAKEEKKKEEPKKTEEKKDPKDELAQLLKAYEAYNSHMPTYYHVKSAEEDPNACVIC